MRNFTFEALAPGQYIQYSRMGKHSLRADVSGFETMCAIFVANQRASCLIGRLGQVRVLDFKLVRGSKASKQYV